MRTESLVFSVMLAYAAGAAAADKSDEQRCPKLAAASGFVWQYSQGPDFGVCYGQNKDAAQLIGVYLGFAANFHADPKLLLRDGKIGTDSVHWYKKQAKDEGFKVGVETLYPRGNSTAHVWLLAKDDASLSSLMALAESLSFADVK